MTSEQTAESAVSATHAPKTISAAPQHFKVSANGNEGVLLGSRCKDCGTAFFGPTGHCRRCTSDRIEPIELSGEGVLRSFTIIFRAPVGWAGPEPYALAEVELPEGVAVRSRLTEWAEGEELEIGSRYEIAVTLVGRDEEGDELAVYTWRQSAGRGER